MPKINKNSAKIVNDKNISQAQRDEENIDLSSYMDDESYMSSNAFQRDKFSELYNEAVKRK
jgi:hypothetical protein